MNRTPSFPRTAWPAWFNAARLEQTVRGRQRAPRFGKTDEQHFFPMAVALAADYPGLGLDIGREVDFASPGNSGNEDQEDETAQVFHGA
jgi:hypothetical protein